MALVYSIKVEKRLQFLSILRDFLLESAKDVLLEEGLRPSMKDIHALYRELIDLLRELHSKPRRLYIPKFDMVTETPPKRTPEQERVRLLYSKYVVENTSVKDVLSTDMTQPSVCADCGHEQSAMDRPCDACMSRRVILLSFVKDVFGDDWKNLCFGKQTENG